MLLKLLASPNIASKEWAYRQYDHHVMTNTVVEPGGDAAVLRIKGTRKGIALTTDGNGRYCYLDPYQGGMIAVAEACRNVSVVGAEPIALTDCLNFGNPEKPEVYFQLEECVKGMAAASAAFGAPVISGNVSLYNETHGKGIYPTPIIGALGLLEDVTAHAGMAFRHEGDVVVLLGADGIASPAASMGGSEYLEVVHGLVAGHPTIDLELETAVQECCRRGISEGLIESAHDCSDGGLAVAIAESCIAGGMGFAGDFAVPGRWDAALFGEAQSRIVVTVSQPRLADLLKLCEAVGCPAAAIGRWRRRDQDRRRSGSQRRGGGSRLEDAALTCLPRLHGAVVRGRQAGRDEVVGRRGHAGFLPDARHGSVQHAHLQRVAAHGGRCTSTTSSPRGPR